MGIEIKGRASSRIRAAKLADPDLNPSQLAKRLGVKSAEVASALGRDPLQTTRFDARDGHKSGGSGARRGKKCI